MISLPRDSGSYLLLLHLDRARRIEVGRLGRLLFPPGFYLYAGSACGPGGLQARLGRHLSGGGRLHWHIDYLRRAALVAGFAYLAEAGKSPLKQGSEHRLECLWSLALAAWPGASFPAAGFGASDCPGACPSHLVHLPSPVFQANPPGFEPAAWLVDCLADAGSAAPERFVFKVKWGEFENSVW